MSALQLNPFVTVPLSISAWVTDPWIPDSVVSPGRQWAIGMDALAIIGNSVTSISTLRIDVVRVMFPLPIADFRVRQCVRGIRDHFQVVTRQNAAAGKRMGGAWIALR
jgi:hypothetical protein